MEVIGRGEFDKKRTVVKNIDGTVPFTKRRANVPAFNFAKKTRVTFLFTTVLEAMIEKFKRDHSVNSLNFREDIVVTHIKPSKYVEFDRVPVAAP